MYSVGKSTFFAMFGAMIVALVVSENDCLEQKKETPVVSAEVQGKLSEMKELQKPGARTRLGKHMRDVATQAHKTVQEASRKSGERADQAFDEAKAVVDEQSLK